MDSALHTIDWVILGAYLLLALGLGSFFFRQASSGVESFFVGDRNLPWWLAGTSIVATTFAADTPLAVTGIVASGGISGNWIWWSWAIAHLTSTFLFARLWRRSGVITDAEITELRYGGRAAAVLRGFKAVYWGLFINCLIMAWVIKAMVKIAQALFDVPAGAVIGAAVSVCVLYTTLGGYRSVVLTDLFQFGLGMAGAVVLAVFVVRDFGGLGSAGAAPGAGGLLPQLERVLAAGGRELEDVLAMVPRSDHPTMPLVAFVVLLLAGWWRYAEGNGYIVQRLASCRSEQDAQGAALWFSVAHNSLRPWPWIVVALAALVVYPQLAPAPPAAIELEGPSSVVITPGHLDVAGGGSVQVRGAPPGSRLTILDQSRRLERAADGSLRAWFARFGGSAVTAVELEAPDGRRWRGAGFVVQLADREMAYPLMVRRYLPAGVLGLVLASLVAAFMSTIDTHTNWGASYLVQDLYRRFLHPAASEREAVRIGRLCIVLMALLAGGAALIIESIASVWQFLITLGAGLGSVSAVRWYWSRVTPHAELAAMGVTTVLALMLQLFFSPTLFGAANPWLVLELGAWQQIVIIALASLATWIPVSLLGPQNDPETLRRFAARVRPPGPGWRGYRAAATESMRPALQRLLAGAIVVFGSLFGIGHLILGRPLWGGGLLMAAALAFLWILRSEPAAKGPLSN